jgi:hypothetical protein
VGVSTVQRLKKEFNLWYNILFHPH